MASPSMLGLVQRMISVDALVVEAAEQLLDPELVGPDALDRADRALQHVVAAPELAGLLDGHDVAGLLDHADHGGVAARVGADRALVALGDVEAPGAERDLVLDLDDGRGQAQGVVARAASAGGRRCAGPTSGPTPGQPPELVDQVLDRTGVGAHGASSAVRRRVVQPSSASIGVAADARPPEVAHAAEAAEVEAAHRRLLQGGRSRPWRRAARRARGPAACRRRRGRPPRGRW